MTKCAHGTPLQESWRECPQCCADEEEQYQSLQAYQQTQLLEEIARNLREAKQSPKERRNAQRQQQQEREKREERERQQRQENERRAEEEARREQQRARERQQQQEKARQEQIAEKARQRRRKGLFISVFAIIAILLIGGFVIFTSLKSQTDNSLPKTVPAEKAYVNTLQVNMRSGPGSEYGIVTKLSKGDSVTCLERSQSSDGGGWVKIRAGSFEGWVNQKLLSKDNPSL